MFGAERVIRNEKKTNKNDFLIVSFAIKIWKKTKYNLH